MIDIKETNFNFSGFGQSLLQCLACLLPFLDHDLIDNLPYLTASTIAVLPEELHQDVINYLCFYILPFTIGKMICQIQSKLFIPHSTEMATFSP